MIGLIIQSRLGSRRLPNKALADIEGVSMLRRVIQRCKKAVQIDQITVDVPSKDQSLLNEIAKERVGWWFGSDDRDVLGDYEAIARTCGYDTVVRITGDCPCIMPCLIDQVILAHETHCMMPALHHYTALLDVDGWDVEVFDGKALEWSVKKADPIEREHVTMFMRNQIQVSDMILGLPDAPNVKLSVDTQEDLDRVRDYYRELGEDFGIDETIRKNHSDNRRNGKSWQGIDEDAPRIITL